MADNNILCDDVIYSEEYVDFIVDYNRESNYELIGSVMECTQYVDDQLAVIYKPFTESEFLVNMMGYRYLPQCYGFLGTEALQETGILRLREQPFFDLYGTGVLIGIIDSGIDFMHEAFIWEDNTSKIVSAWNQEDREGTPPEGFLYGSEYTREDINTAIRMNQDGTYDSNVNSLANDSEHGTTIAGAAAGRIIEEEDFSGAAPLSELVVVKLKEAKNIYRDYYRIADGANAYQENDIMLGIRYLINVSLREQKPIVICIGVGTNQGDHNGTGPLCEYINDLATTAGIYFCVAAGNETGKAHHFRGRELGQNEYQDVEIYTGENSKGFILELWGGAANRFAVEIKPPIGAFSSRIQARFNEKRSLEFLLNDSVVEVSSEIVELSTGDELMFLRFIDPAPGIWVIRVFQETELPGSFDMWLPMEQFLSSRTVFLEPEPEVTICEPGNTTNVITFSGSDIYGDVLYINSSRGYTRGGRIKPDITAPAVSVFTTRSTTRINRYGEVTGTSMAAAIGAGAVALIAEWSLENIPTSSIGAKNYLIRGADREGLSVPDRSWGWGRLNIYQTFIRVGE